MRPVPLLNSGLASPFEQFFLVLGVFSAMPLLVGAPAPQSVAHLLSPLLVHVWAGFLGFGCLTALVGTHWEQAGRVLRREPRHDTGLLIEQFGMVSAGVGTLIYSVGLVLTGIPGVDVAASIVLAYGLACFWRAWQIQRWVRVAIRDKGAR